MVRDGGLVTYLEFVVIVVSEEQVLQDCLSSVRTSCSDLSFLVKSLHRQRHSNSVQQAEMYVIQDTKTFP